jgi:hypothetical protein
VKRVLVATVVCGLAFCADASAQTATNRAPQASAQASGGFSRGMGGGFGRGMRGGFGGGLAFGRNGASLIEVVARVTGQEPAAVFAALQEGKTLAQVGEASGKSPAELVEAVLAERRIIVSQAVSDGRLTQQQADQMMPWMKTQIETNVQAASQPRGRGGRFGGRCPWANWTAGPPATQ